MPISLTRSILAILLPGGVATIPWIVLAVSQWPTVAALYSKHETLVAGFLFGVFVVIGKMFETKGSNVESQWDKEREDDYAVDENWYSYLARSIEPEPVGHRYIGRMVTSLYFELTMAFASVSFFAGCATLAFVSELEVRPVLMISSLLLAFLAPRYFLDHAKDSHKVLCETRQKINTILDAAA